MKTSDIVVGTDHAYIHHPTSYYKGARQRVRVLATEVQFTTGHGWRQKTHTNGVEILFVADNGRKRPGTKSQVVKPAHIESTWANWLGLEDSQQSERLAEAHRFKVTAHRMRVKGYLALLGLKPLRWPQDGDYTIGTRSESFEFDADGVMKLITTVAGLAEIVGNVPTLNLVKATTRKVRGEDRYQILVNGVAVDEDWYSQDEAIAYANAINEGVKPSHCPNCGAAVEEDATLCPNCGEDLCR